MIRKADIEPEMLTRLSRYADEVARRYPDAPPPDRSVEPPDDEALAADPEEALRRYRQLSSVHLLWQDLAGRHDIETTGQALSALARRCLELGLKTATARVAKDHGLLLDQSGEPIGLGVIGMGKLGGDELNFNSDIDLVFIHRARGQSDGRRRLDAAAYLKKVALDLIQLLDAVTAQGRVWIVDTRLRPFGDAGALVWSIGAMEQYFLNEGRTWERYAWLKAAPAAGDRSAADELIHALRPFVFRRYLDYGIFESLRELHDQIDASSRARSRRDDIKRGPGGIRELEFLIQSEQILRGGRDADLRTPGFLPALSACRSLRIIDDSVTEELAGAYGFLRILENRLQAMTGRQGHDLPENPADRDRLRRLMGAGSWAELRAEIDHHRARVRHYFAERFGQNRQHRSSPPLLYWPPDEQVGERLEQAGFADTAVVAELLQNLHRRTAGRSFSAEGRRRLERLMPELLTEVVQHDDPSLGLKDLLRLIDQISRRSAYLALLHERPATLERLVRVFRQSGRLAEWIVNSPQLLDDLLDPVHGLDLPAPPRADADDPEATLNALGRWRQAGFLRTALAELDGRLDACAAARQLAEVAETTLDRVLALIRENESDLAVIAYGNLGAGLLHFESDLDLVFLHREGTAPARTAQRLISYMQLPLPGGRLFEIDTRLRPNGRAGLLVSNLERFIDYQSSQAWTWEHQALIRARWVAGNEALREPFEQARRTILAGQREQARVIVDLAEMRLRQRNERAESAVKRLLTDLQFIAECGVLCQAGAHPELLESRQPDRQLSLLGQIGWLPELDSESLVTIWQKALSLRHQQWLVRDAAERPEREHSEAVAAAWQTVFGQAS